MPGANQNLTTSPIQCGGSQGGGIAILNGASRSQDVLPSSSNITHPPLKSTLTLLKIPVHQKNYTQFNTLPSEILNTIDTWHLNLVHQDNFQKVLAQLTHNNKLLSSTRYYRLKYVLLYDTVKLLRHPLRVGGQIPTP